MNVMPGTGRSAAGADGREARTYRVLVNDEEQYGIHPGPLPAPDGWSETGFSGTEDDCAAWVDTRWTDLRPRSLRERTAPGGGHRR